MSADSLIYAGAFLVLVLLALSLFGWLSAQLINGVIGAGGFAGWLAVFAVLLLLILAGFLP